MLLPKWMKPLVVRRVRGRGMAPKLRPGQLLVATPLFRRLRPGQVVIVEKDDKELVKRIERIDNDMIFLISDNLEVKNDSRQFGWLSREAIRAKVLRPDTAK